MARSVFIDGGAGTTGLEIADRLRGREEFDLVALDDARRKDPAARAEALDVLIAITTAAVAANSGPAMGRTHPAQRKAREALFLLVQAQTAAGRAATLTRLANRA